MQCLHITHMAIYTLVGLKPQSKHIYSRGTAAITSQWAKLQYTSELLIQTDLWQSHIHCVIPVQEESSAPRAGEESSAQLLLWGHLSRNPPEPEPPSPNPFILWPFPTTTWNVHQLPGLHFMSLSPILFFLMPLLGDVKKLSVGLDFYN